MVVIVMIVVNDHYVTIVTVMMSVVGSHMSPTARHDESEISKQHNVD
jgi:hypothetical protein